MDCAPVPKLIDGPGWVYEIKFDGYRAVAVKSDGRVALFSRRRKSFDHHYPLIIEALAELPEGTVVDGEIVALDESGRPNFNLLQNFRSEASHIHYFVFDLLICQDRDLTRLPLSERRKLMKSHLKLHSNRIRMAEQFEASASDMLAAVRQQQLEGVIGKRKDSLYEPGKRTGSWVKCRVNQGQELVIGGYIPGPGGWACVLRYKDHVRELSGAEHDTTNNRMELRAVIEGLRALKRPCAVVVRTDSKYVKDGMTKWIHNWKSQGWVRKEKGKAGKQPIKNRELWEEVERLQRIHNVAWEWVKGHANDEDNKRCDVLANMAAQSLNKLRA